MRRREESALVLVGLCCACFSKPPTVGGHDDGDETGSSSSATVDTSSSSPSESSSPADSSSGSESDSAATEEGSTGVDESGEAESDSGETGAVPGMIGPLFPPDDFSDGAIFPDGAGATAQWFPSGEYNEMGLQYLGEYPIGHRYYAYLRFELPRPIAADAVVDDVRLVLYGHDVYDWQATDALRVWIQHTDDAAAVGGIDHYPGTSIPLADASVRWPEELGLAWQHPGANETPNLAVLVQQLVDEYGGLAAGAHLQLWVSLDEIDGLGKEVGWVDSHAGPDTSPQLTIALSASE